jgi:hypothetical protein
MKLEVSLKINLERSKKMRQNEILLIVEPKEKSVVIDNPNMIVLDSKKKQRGSITVDYTVVLPIVKKGFSSYEIDFSSASEHMFGNGNYRKYLGRKFGSVEDIRRAIDSYNVNHMVEKLPKITSYDLPA